MRNKLYYYSRKHIVKTMDGETGENIRKEEVLVI